MLSRLAEHRVAKPWGRTDLPEAFGERPDKPIGEIWFEREAGDDDALLVKYLFTSERLSVQVHPDDAVARAAGHRSGKDEAWLILAAEPDAKLGIGLREPLTPDALRTAALDGSIADMLDWRAARSGDAYYSPAGTLHSIGAGLTLLEVQQNCDLTYRLYDFGRPRELHLDSGIAAARPGARIEMACARPIAEGREIVAQGPKFTLERWRSAAGKLQANAGEPLWLIPLWGTVTANGQELEPPSVWIAEEPVRIDSATGEVVVAYEGSAIRP